MNVNKIILTKLCHSGVIVLKGVIWRDSSGPGLIVDTSVCILLDDHKYGIPEIQLSILQKKAIEVIQANIFRVMHVCRWVLFCLKLLIVLVILAPQQIAI